ncbi:MAG: type II toxin-antitoxin system RelE/ParE family toxin [Gammaproteobacteria bacterium]|nr:type II toxin-antitoxin system RelE/ParE family toxin [Gammaproteobacteria bacterium]
MTWTIDYYNQSVYEEAKALPKLINAKFEAIMDKMTEHGPDLGMPFTKSFGKGLFEIRAKAQEGIARGFYCTIKERKIIILHVFVKKSQATPKKELDLAKKRLSEVKNHDI